jgi:hypothetical protein
MWNTNWKRISIKPYWFAKIPEHPKATKHGYVLEHRVIMENKIGRLLLNNEIVHHKNGNKKDNTEDNLELMTKSQHNIFHNSIPLQEIICPICKKKFYKKPGYIKYKIKHNKTHTLFCSKKCASVIYKGKRIGLIPGGNYKKEIDKILFLSKNKNLTAYAIAKKYNLNQQTIILHMKKNNLFKKHKGKNSDKYINYIKKGINNGLCDNAISVKYNISKSSVRYIIQKYNLRGDWSS